LHHELGVQQRDQLGSLGAAGGIVAVRGGGLAGMGCERKAENKYEEQSETMQPKSCWHDGTILLGLKFRCGVGSRDQRG